MKQDELTWKINEILSVEKLEERLEMSTLSALSSYCFNGNTTIVYT